MQRQYTGPEANMPTAKKMSNAIEIKRQFPNPSVQTSEGRMASHLQILTWGKGMEKASFYIQSKGEHAGRPLNSPIANCWAVYTNAHHLKQIAFGIYLSGQLRTMLIGSVIPFIRLREYRPLLTEAFSSIQNYNQDNLRTLELLDAQLETLNKQTHLIRQYQKALAYKINHHLFTPQS